MSNIYEALEQAQRDVSGFDESLISTTPNRHEKEATMAREKPVKSHVIPSLETDMYCLYQNIEYLLPDTSEKTIMFMGIQGGEGVSTIVRDFANMAANRLDKKVLIMDAAHHNPSQHLYFNIRGGGGWKEVMVTGDPADNACHQADNPNLYLAAITPQKSMNPQVCDHMAVTGFLKELKKKYDYILIDSSPAATSPESISISRFTHGVVLVLEAERTRWQVVDSVRNRIIRNNGTVIGVVLNKRKYHIPDSIYRRLF